MDKFINYVRQFCQKYTHFQTFKNLQEKHWRAYQNGEKWFHVKHCTNGILKVPGDNSGVQISNSPIVLLCVQEAITHATSGDFGQEDEGLATFLSSEQ